MTAKWPEVFDRRFYAEEDVHGSDDGEASAGSETKYERGLEVKAGRRSRELRGQGATALREGGYATWHVGKWHLGERYEPQDHGFEVNVGGCHWGAPKKGYFSPYHIRNLENGPEGEYLTDRLTEETIRLIELPGSRQALLLNLSHYAVHTPIQAPMLRDYGRDRTGIAPAMIIQRLDLDGDGQLGPRELPRLATFLVPLGEATARPQRPDASTADDLFGTRSTWERRTRRASSDRSPPSAGSTSTTTASSRSTTCSASRAAAAC